MQPAEVCSECGQPFLRHGRRVLYIAGCRCPECAQASSLYQRDLRMRQGRPTWADADEAREIVGLLAARYGNTAAAARAYADRWGYTPSTAERFFRRLIAGQLRVTADRLDELQVMR